MHFVNLKCTSAVENIQILQQDSIRGVFSNMSKAALYYSGGAPFHRDHLLLIQAIIHGSSLPRDLDLKGLFLLRPDHVIVRSIGEVIAESDENETPRPPPKGKQPITFVTKHSHVRLPPWNAGHRGTLEFQFRTVEPTGLILFSGGATRQSDFIAVEIYDAILYLVVNLRNRVHRFPFNSKDRPIDKGQPHYVQIDRNGQELQMTLDGDRRRHTIDSSANLELGSTFFVGGVDIKERLPWHVWTGDAAGIALGEDRKYFRGCIWDLKMNGQESVDLESYAGLQEITGIERGCREVPVDCVTNPCHDGAPCTERWNGFFCDCSETSFTGKRCELGLIHFMRCSLKGFLKLFIIFSS